MSTDAEYLKNYIAHTLYVNPSSNGCFATMVADGIGEEVVLGSVEAGSRTRIAVKAFYVKEHGNYASFRIVRIQYHKTYGWREVESLNVSRFEAEKIRAFASVLSTLDLSDGRKTKIKLGAVQLGDFSELLRSSEGENLIQALSNSPDLHRDIVALRAKRNALREFEGLMIEGACEADWQKLFEENPWIFGHGLKYVFLTGVGFKLEAYTSGFDFARSGKEVDAFLRTRAEVSQFVLVEIKRADTDLVARRPYRSGCWAVSDEVSGAVSQIQKTVFDFTQQYYRQRLKDEQGKDLPDEVFAIEPESFLVVGNLGQLSGYADKITCFELYRKALRCPTILTFDELFHRAKFIVEHLSTNNSS